MPELMLKLWYVDREMDVAVILVSSRKPDSLPASGMQQRRGPTLAGGFPEDAEGADGQVHAETVVVAADDFAATIGMGSGLAAGEPVLHGDRVVLDFVLGDLDGGFPPGLAGARRRPSTCSVSGVGFLGARKVEEVRRFAESPQHSRWVGVFAGAGAAPVIPRSYPVPRCRTLAARKRPELVAQVMGHVKTLPGRSGTGPPGLKSCDSGGAVGRRSSPRPDSGPGPARRTPGRPPNGKILPSTDEITDHARLPACRRSCPAHAYSSPSRGVRRPKRRVWQIRATPSG